MYIQEISININVEIDKDEIIDEFSLLMSFYRSNGQTQGRIESQYIKKEEIFCLPYTLEKNSLKQKTNNFYVNKQIQRIEKICKSKLKFKTIGKSYSNYKSSCECKKNSFYILATDYITIESPLKCGFCNKSVPLYRLPAYYDHGYMPILSWETNYKSCDDLQMNCEVGEDWALNQMEEVHSQLSKQGNEICKKIEQLTSTPTFYFLYNYNKYKNDLLSRPCPNCNEKWNLETPLHNTYNFKCDNCNLVSILSPNT